jgi:parallel beta-helix repeat protein
MFIYTPGLTPVVTDNTINTNEWGIYVYGTNTAPTIMGNTIDLNRQDGLTNVYGTPTIGGLNPNTFKSNGGWGIHSMFGEPLNAGTLGDGLADPNNVFGRGAEANALGDIVQEWHVRVYVTHLGAPVADADVNVWQNQSYPPNPPVWTGKTGPTGYTPWIYPYLKEYEWDNTGTLWDRADHLFLAVKSPWTGSGIEKVDSDMMTVHVEID